MRKNFLILMLMALLPLAGWAATDMGDVNFSAPDFSYGTATQPDFLVTYDITLTKDTHYSWDGVYYSDAACETATTYTVAKLPVGTYYVKIEGIGTGGFSGTNIQSFKVTPATLTVTVSATGAGLNKEYDGTTAKTDDVALTWTATGYKNSEDAGVVIGTLDWSYEDPSVGNPTITFTGLSADNYEIAYNTNNFLNIGKRTLTTSMITPVTLTETYKGAAFTPSELAVNVADGSLLTSSDYTIKTYSDEGFTTEVASPINVATYYIGISASTSGNYQTSAPLAAGTFKITKANLTMKAKDQSHVYDALAISTHFTATEYQYIGLVGSDTPSDIASPSISVADDTKTAVGTYTITASGATNSNYNIYFQPGTYSITPREMTITADDKTWIYGGTEPTYTASLSGNISSEASAIQAAITVGREDGDDDALGEHDIIVTVDGTADVLANYEYSTVNGTLTISGGDIVVTVNPQTITYGEDEPDWANPVKGTDYFVNGLADGDALTVTLTRADADTKDAGTYAVTASAELPTGYSSINFVNSTFTIEKAALTVNADQTLVVGASAANLSTDACEITGLASSDDADDVITLTFGTGVTVDGDGVLTTAQTVTNGIIVSLTTAGATNYNLTTSSATLTVTAALVLNRIVKADFSDADKNDAAAKIAANDGNTTDVTFTFPGQTMYANKWYSWVLPFETTVRAISKAFGYAVVDVLDEENNSADDVNFKQYLGTVAANQPFILKVDQNITADDFAAAATTVKFESVEIDAPEADPKVEDAYGNKFIGTYTGIDGGLDSTTDYIFGLAQSATTYQPGSTQFIRPLGAYIKFKDAQSSSAPRHINIEEPDGSVTSINVATGKVSVTDAEGWYTVSGAKLNAAPAQKGVYIKDGKKFIVK